MRYIIVGIEAEAKECGECRNFFQEPDNGPAYCEQITWWGDIVSKGIPLENVRGGWLRCPACLSAEAKLTALREAAGTAVKEWRAWVDDQLEGTSGYKKASRAVDACDQALAAIKEPRDEAK